MISLVSCIHHAYIMHILCIQVELAGALSSNKYEHEVVESFEGMASAVECLASVVTHGTGIKQRNKLQKTVNKTKARLAQMRAKGSAKGSAKASATTGGKKKAKAAKKKKQKR